MIIDFGNYHYQVYIYYTLYFALLDFECNDQLILYSKYSKTFANCFKSFIHFNNYIPAPQFDLQHERLHGGHRPPFPPPGHPSPQSGPQDAWFAEEDLQTEEQIGRADQSEVTGLASSECGHGDQGTHFAHTTAHTSGIGGL